MARYCFWTGTVLCIIMAMEAAAANQFNVGGNQGWAPPSGSEKETYNQWAERYRFLINDTIVFKYDPSMDSVLLVNKQDYDTCTTSNPIQSFKDGNTVFQFPKHGPFHFISGNATNCQKGEKLVIVVLSPHPRGKSALSPAPATTVASPPSPVPSTVATPPPSSVAPSPAPSTVVSSPPAVSPSVVPVASPLVAPVVAPTVASGPSTGMGPANSATFISSPTPAPVGSEGGVVPSGAHILHPCFASAASAVLVLALSVAF